MTKFSMGICSSAAVRALPLLATRQMTRSGESSNDDDVDPFSGEEAGEVMTGLIKNAGTAKLTRERKK